MKVIKPFLIVLFSLHHFASSGKTNDSIKFEVFLNEKMLNESKLNIEMINSFNLTSDDFLLLSSINQFYLLGLGGMVPVFEASELTINSFTITYDGSLFAICDNQLCIEDQNKLVKLFDLPNKRMGIASGKETLYIFDKDLIPYKSNYSMYMLLKNRTYTKLIDVPTPIKTVLEVERFSLFSTENKIFCVDIKNEIVKEIVSLEDKNENIISLAQDSKALYFSTNSAIFRLQKGKIECVNSLFGGLLLCDKKGLLVFNPEKNLIIRFRNSILYYNE